MANNVIVQVIGGSKQVKDGLNTVRDAMSVLGIDETYTAASNGSPVGPSHTLNDNDYVTFSKSVKGGR